MFPQLYRWRALLSLVVALALVLPLRGDAEPFTGKVVGISDGDTLSVLREGKAVKVRLHGVDTPERAQAFGTQARQFTSDLAFQQTVTVEVRQTDRYGRLVGEVRLPDGRSLNQALVEAGMAWWYRPWLVLDSRVVDLSMAYNLYRSTVFWTHSATKSCCRSQQTALRMSDLGGRFISMPSNQPGLIVSTLKPA